MANELKKKELRDTAAGLLPDVVITMAFVEHQIDLMGKIILDLAEDASLAPEKQQRVDMLKDMMRHSSIDFTNITHPLQSYKVPKTIEYKENTRQVQRRYLEAQIREGVFG